MLILLHGENIVASRLELDRLKSQSRNKEIITIDGQKATETDLIQSLETNSLFGSDKLIVFESLLSSKKALNWEKIIKENKDKEIIFWEPKEIGKLIQNKIPKETVVKLFKTPVVIFQFLESLLPGNFKNSLSLYHQCLQKEEPEMIFFMLVRQIRSLIIVKDASPAEITTINPWQISRLTKQAGCFTMNKLILIYQNLLHMDIAIKTGKEYFKLSSLIERFLISI